ncbi:four-carbon acid sugar kinase family protein [Tunicatimonas pelagia]|uniref:four-carbon acid sugar kinase family protein n=1 Tax=Tunicatimonas pelagia TaxID=931531 RepID=UPI002666B7D0|nr:four-carbon acid sugar kinase family protein [Tunicatimonas pelagia]WKN46265.1 four-carbon acid sugar kinase family protein [Tunicatimonas pelagia]
MPTTLQQLLQNVPPAPKESLLPEIRQKLSSMQQTIVVLDDDPTGTQTVYDVPVLTEWSTEVIEAEFRQATPLFFILTNSRSLPIRKANQLAATIGQNLNKAAQKAGRNFFVISRSDSTLRGHYPNEVNALLVGMQQTEAIRILIPAFLEGGRYTINDTHYVQEGNDLIPVGKTPFAQDKSFGFSASNLKDWIEEKTEGGVKAKDVVSLSLSDLRQKGAGYATETLNAAASNATCIVNAVHRFDLEIFALGLLNADVPVICRTAASIVPVLAGLAPKPLLTCDQLLPQGSANGGLIVVGSYVPKSTAQLEHLLEHASVQPIKLDVNQILEHSDPEDFAQQAAQQIDQLLTDQQDTVVYTSRDLVSGQDKEENLKIGQRVSSFLTNVIKQISIKPRYILAKGGITSSDTATKGLGVKKANVLGQILPGVPVWKLGEESKFPELTYIVFPGNVGEADSITKVINQLKTN